MSKKVKNRIASIALPVLVGVVFVYIWQIGLLNAAGGLTTMQLPLPSDIYVAMQQKGSKIFSDAGVTLAASLIGLAIGCAVGYFVAILATMAPRWGYGSLTVLSALNAVPIVALACIMNRWFSTAMGSKIAVVAIVCMATMGINAYRGLNDLQPFACDLMKSYAAPRSAEFLKLRIPNSIPNIFVALKINIVNSMMTALISEYFSKDTAGLGFTIKTSMKMGNQKATGWAYIVVAALLSILLYIVIALVERRALRWHASHR
ncbi:MAG: ABC transporter permease subunit [Oscillospiraceae bacterium]|jgi:NitT/TauT family transport system permease protein|nr:ABC transporter permease subunit [Oscillospiraceae bacterium]